MALSEVSLTALLPPLMAPAEVSLTPLLPCLPSLTLSKQKGNDLNNAQVRISIDLRQDSCTNASES